eukprot:8351774-Alexandrium_andersonii.AAC.1
MWSSTLTEPPPRIDARAGPGLLASSPAGRALPCWAWRARTGVSFVPLMVRSTCSTTFAAPS